MIICVNGQPTAGKDTFCDFCIEARPSLTKSFSTVDLVKDIARQCGWDGTKTAANRKFLADLKQLLVDWDNVPYKNIVKRIDDEKFRVMQWGIPTKELLIFVHVREPKEIEKFVSALGAKTLLVRRPEIEGATQSNSSDADVFQIKYDYEIINDGSLMDLKKKAEQFLAYLKEEEEI